MLGKLLKYDCRCTARSFIPIGLIYLIVSVFMRILTQFEDAFSGNLILIVAIVLYPSETRRVSSKVVRQ